VRTSTPTSIAQLSDGWVDPLVGLGWIGSVIGPKFLFSGGSIMGPLVHLAVSWVWLGR